mmetsp:Transcript_5251/g.13177  ORF Transcript_5251/g.13177 Transcript_5251/m.13177 type:complete len:223 (-) Transcript_5251:38-706(-)
MRALSILLGTSAAFDYKSISINAPRRIVTQDDIDAKFEEVDKPYALYPVDGPAEEGLCVLAEISLTAPNFSWKRDNYIVELLDDQAEPFAAVSTGICDAGVKVGDDTSFSFPVDIDMRAALLPEFGDLEQGTTCSCRVAVRRVVDKQLDYRTPDEKKAIIGDRMRARAVKDSEAVADALLQTAAQDALGPDWRALVARDESLDEDAVPAFLLKNCDVRWVDA